MVRDTGSIRSIGVVGGGQLGRMLALAAAPLGLTMTALDPQQGCPAAVAARTITGSLHDPRALRSLVTSSDVTTVEIEHVGVETLAELEMEGHVIRPSPAVLRIIGDKAIQKEFLSRAGVPVTPEAPPGGPPFSLPVVEKLRVGGYDGRGVHILQPGEHRFFSEPSFFESRVSIARELAVIVCRFPDGRIVTWNPVGMVFDDRLHLVSHVEVPPSDGAGCMDPRITDTAQAIAVAAAEALGSVGLIGILAVELFLDEQGNLMVNEVAPRPHNSGHLTIETSRCSQFQQHVRAVAGLPPGDTSGHSPGVMRNIVAPATCAAGPTAVHGLADALSVPGVSVHLYGKAEQRPGRKMGHLTAIADTVAEARARADRAWEYIGFQEQPSSGETT